MRLVAITGARALAARLAVYQQGGRGRYVMLVSMCDIFLDSRCPCDPLGPQDLRSYINILYRSVPGCKSLETDFRQGSF